MTTAEDARTVRPEEIREASDVTDIVVTAHRSCPEKVVFTENGNTDAWIASDTTITLD